ncbi:hypothetical protein [Lactobacillus johnsonii]
MKNKENAIVFVILVLITAIWFVTGKDSNIGAAIISAWVSYIIWIIQTRYAVRVNMQRKRKKKINQVKVNYYVLLTKINEFPSQLDEETRFKILDENIEERNLDIFSQMSLELQSYEKIFYDASNMFMKSWIHLNNNEINPQIIKDLSDIETDLHKLATKLSPEFVRNGLSETENLKEKIADKMVSFSEEICLQDAEKHLLGKELEINRQYLCAEILTYQKFKEAVNEVIAPLFQDGEKDLTSSKIQEKVEWTKKLNQIILPYSKYAEKTKLTRASGNERNAIRYLMKLWGLKHDKPNKANTNKNVCYNSENIMARKIYYWREPTGSKIIHICNGIGSKQFKELR